MYRLPLFIYFHFDWFMWWNPAYCLILFTWSDQHGVRERSPTVASWIKLKINQWHLMSVWPVSSLYQDETNVYAQNPRNLCHVFLHAVNVLGGKELHQACSWYRLPPQKFVNVGIRSHIWMELAWSKSDGWLMTSWCCLQLWCGATPNLYDVTLTLVHSLSRSFATRYLVDFDHQDYQKSR